MQNLSIAGENFFNKDNSTLDANRFYSVLLDAKAISTSENMCDIAETILTNERENAKEALDHLWKLKNNLFSNKNGTIDLLIDYYQNKINILREKEEHLKKISMDSRTLIEEKRKRDEEVATVKQQITECTKEIEELTERLNKLKIKEQELTLIEHQLNEELNKNENEIINGLYEIIFIHQEELSPALLPPKSTLSSQKEFSSIQLQLDPPPPKDESEILLPPPSREDFEVLNEIPQSSPSSLKEVSYTNPPVNKVEISPLPKSIVKTVDGRIIGEYFYDSKVYKNKRHYIFNSHFLSERILYCIKMLKQKFDSNLYNEMLQIVQDLSKRTSENKNLHFEIATNEILNEKTVKRLLQDIKLKSLDEIEKFALKLDAKIKAMGNNRITILQEQMQRYT